MLSWLLPTTGDYTVDVGSSFADVFSQQRETMGHFGSRYPDIVGNSINGMGQVKQIVSVLKFAHLFVRSEELLISFSCLHSVG